MRRIVASAALAFASAAHAFEWSDNAIGWRYGTKFGEPFVAQDIKKHIASLTHADGWKYGGNFLNVDVLLSHGPIRDWGATFGFDGNRKDDAGYNSRKRMLVLGPKVMLDVPGFLDVGLLVLWESNAPCSTFPGGTCTPRYRYKTHPMLDFTWAIPLGASGLSFEGYLDFIASKGNDHRGPAGPGAFARTPMIRAEFHF